MQCLIGTKKLCYFRRSTVCTCSWRKLALFGLCKGKCRKLLWCWTLQFFPVSRLSVETCETVDLLADVNMAVCMQCRLTWVFCKKNISKYQTAAWLNSGPLQVSNTATPFNLVVPSAGQLNAKSSAYHHIYTHSN